MLALIIQNVKQKIIDVHAMHYYLSAVMVKQATLKRNNQSAKLEHSLAKILCQKNAGHHQKC